MSDKAHTSIERAVQDGTASEKHSEQRSQSSNFLKFTFTNKNSGFQPEKLPATFSPI